ncbi:FAD dependent oxidoreductase [Xylariaceae sp. FL0804]|nr:FAD dependent oxidoreductase [Xylariaceae sp. FL0804]
MSLRPDSRILIVGSGVFGISTALWLARAGYRHVTVLDMQDTGAAGYSPGTGGIDSASADINKIIRFSYGDEIEYQRLASQAARMWDEWNDQVVVASAASTASASAAGASSSESDAPLPPVLQRGDRTLWRNCGFLRMSASGEFGEFELRTLENMEKEGIRHTQFKSDDAADIKRAAETGWLHKMDPCRRQERFGVHAATLDSSGGLVAAYKACAWAQHLARRAGVKFILHPRRGKVVKVDSTASGKPLLRTEDGVAHEGDLVVVAGGGWTASLVPEVSGLLETTAGSVATIQLPRDRRDLWERYSPDNCPVIAWGMREGKGIYSLPRDENGVIKIGFRKTKWTNFDEVDGRRLSTPKTAHVTDKKETNIPMVALDAIKEYISIHFPDLVELGLSSTKLCWYMDSIDNSFVVDFVPGRPGVAVCSGGSGHGFKFLPILGREVVKILEGKGPETVYGRMWRWRRSSNDGEGRNGLEEGEAGPRVLAKQRMATPADWAFADRSSKL